MTLPAQAEFKNLKTEDANSPVHSDVAGAEQESPGSDKEFEIEVTKAGGVSTPIASAVFNDAALPRGFMQRYAELIKLPNSPVSSPAPGAPAAPDGRGRFYIHDRPSGPRSVSADNEILWKPCTRSGRAGHAQCRSASAKAALGLVGRDPAHDIFGGIRADGDGKWKLMVSGRMKPLLLISLYDPCPITSLPCHAYRPDFIGSSG